MGINKSLFKFASSQLFTHVSFPSSTGRLLLPLSSNLKRNCEKEQ